MKNMPRFLRFGALPMAIGVLAASSAAAAESPGPLQQAIGNPADWNITASVRVRYETLDGGARAGFEPDSDLIAIKSTLAIEYKSGALWIGAQLDDSRIYRGSADGSVTANDVNTFEPVQAYVGLDLGDALGKGSKTSLLGGRFMTNLGSRRFLSSDEYRNATSAYTGLRVDFKAAEGTAATLFYLLPQLHLPDDQPSICSCSARWFRIPGRLLAQRRNWAFTGCANAMRPVGPRATVTSIPSLHGWCARPAQAGSILRWRGRGSLARSARAARRRRSGSESTLEWFMPGSATASRGRRGCEWRWPMTGSAAIRRAVHTAGSTRFTVIAGANTGRQGCFPPSVAPI